MSEMNQEEQLTRRSLELYTLRNRLHRYWKKLVAVSIGVAKERGIKSRFIEFGDIVEDDQKIHIHTDGENVDVSELLKLAQDRVPSLYRRYQTGRHRYEQGIRELELMVQET